MSIFVHCAGELIREPAAKTSSGGKAYAQLLVKAGSGEASQIVSGLVFGELAEAALALEKGDSVSIAGRASLGIYEKDGEHRPSLSIFVSKLLAGKPDAKAKREPGAKAEPSTEPRRAPPRDPQAGGGHFADLEDDIPF